MAPNSVFYDEFAVDARFNSLIRKKRKISFILFSISMILFFSIPVISSYAPDFFRIQFMGRVNVGLAYLIVQYVAGGLIAWKYAKYFSQIDLETKELLASKISGKQ